MPALRNEGGISSVISSAILQNFVLFVTTVYCFIQPIQAFEALAAVRKNREPLKIKDPRFGGVGGIRTQ